MAATGRIGPCACNDPDVILMVNALGALDALTPREMQGSWLKLWKRDRQDRDPDSPHSVEEALLLASGWFVQWPAPRRIHKE